MNTTTGSSGHTPLMGIALAAALALGALAAAPLPADAAELDLDAVNKMDQAAFTEAPAAADRTAMSVPMPVSNGP
jgi:hypothetical protein